MHTPVKLWIWVVTASVLFVVTLGTSLGFTVYYVQANDAVQCQALNDILQFANLKNQPFESAIHEWAVNYRCQRD